MSGLLPNSRFATGCVTRKPPLRAGRGGAGETLLVLGGSRRTPEALGGPGAGGTFPRRLARPAPDAPVGRGIRALSSTQGDWMERMVLGAGFFAGARRSRSEAAGARTAPAPGPRRPPEGCRTGPRCPWASTGQVSGPGPGPAALTNAERSPRTGLRSAAVWASQGAGDTCGRLHTLLPRWTHPWQRSASAGGGDPDRGARGARGWRASAACLSSRRSLSLLSLPTGPPSPSPANS